MNAVTQADPVAKLRTQLTAMAPEFRNALPSHIKPEKFQRVVMTVVQQQPDLLQADRRSLLASCTKCAADGLVPDGREAALVIFNTKVKENGQERWEKRVQYMPMMAGLQKRARNSGEIAGIEAHVIYEHDEFLWTQGTDATLKHVPKFPGPRGRAIGAYAIARFKDGSVPQVEVMDADEIESVRAVSRSKDKGPWVDWWGEMARKTVFRRLSKWLPSNADVDDLIRRDDENEVEAPSGVVVDGVAEEPPAAISAPSKLDALEGEIIPPEPIDTAPADTKPDPMPKGGNEAQRRQLQKFVDDLAAATTSDAYEAVANHDDFKQAMNWAMEHATNLHAWLTAKQSAAFSRCMRPE